MTLILIFARALHFGSGMILAGAVAFRWLVLAPGLDRIGPEGSDFFAALDRRLRLLFIGSGALLILSGAAYFWITSAMMSGANLSESFDRETLRTVLLATHFGVAFQVKLILIALLAGASWPLTKGPAKDKACRSTLDGVRGLLALALLASNAWIGHAAAASGPLLPWRIAGDAIHLVATAIWPTGLLFFWLFLPAAGAAVAIEDLEPALAVVSRFSRVSLVAVLALSASGLGNSYFIVGSFSALITTTYGKILGSKLLLFGLILFLAAWNRFRLLPSLRFTAEPNDRRLLFHRLRNFVRAELLLAALIVLVVSILGITPPPQ